MNQASITNIQIFPFEQSGPLEINAVPASSKYDFVPPPPLSIPSCTQQQLSEELYRREAPLVIPNLFPGMRYETSDGYSLSMFSHSYSVEYPNGTGGVGRISSSYGSLRGVKYGVAIDQPTHDRAVEYLNLIGEQVTKHSTWGFSEDRLE